MSAQITLPVNEVLDTNLLVDATNIALGVLVVGLLVIVILVTLREVVHRLRYRRSSMGGDDPLATMLTTLGITMQDGGEGVDKRDHKDCSPGI